MLGPTDSGSSAETGGQSLEAGPPDYFQGDCRRGQGSGAIPTDAGATPHNLTVLATGIDGSSGLEVDAMYAYFASGSAITRIPLAGGAAQVMVSGASPVATALVNGTLVWLDATVSSQATLLSVPVTALGSTAFANQDGGTSTDSGTLQANVLGTLSGPPGVLTVSGGYAYFSAGDVIARVSLTGGSVETVTIGLAPTGMAVGSAGIYLGDAFNDTIDWAPLGIPDGAPVEGLFAQSNGSSTQVALNGNDLYWGDRFGSLDHVTLTGPSAWQVSGTPCLGGACYPRHVRAGGPGAVWESGDNICGHVGAANAQGATLFATNIAAVQSIAVDAQHLYANTVLGELLRFDL
jgi:hypothetical protein